MVATSLPSTPFNDLVSHRHSVYPLDGTLPAGVTDETIAALIKDTLEHTPSSFNYQSARIVYLAGAEHKKFWDLATEIVNSKLPEAAKAPMQQRVDMFKAAYGSIHFFEDQATLAKAKDDHKNLAGLFDEWSEHSSGMHQYVLWCSLESCEGLGANLQHYVWDPEFTSAVTKNWNLPSDWKMRAQLVFGKIKEGAPWPGQKEKKPNSETYKAFGVSS